MKTNLKNQKGFTLIELVVVMVILALLAAVAVPKFLDLQKQAEAGTEVFGFAEAGGSGIS